jgi:hypothetical protein
MKSGGTDNEWESPRKLSVLRLILKRFALKLGYAIWSGWLSILVFTLLLGLIMYLLTSYECPVRRALGFPLSRSKDVATGFYEYPWEQDCEAKTGNP